MVNVIYEFIVGEILSQEDLELLASLTIKMLCLPEFFIPNSPTVLRNPPTSPLGINNLLSLSIHIW